METPQWLQDLLDDPMLTDICMNGAQQVFIEKRGQPGIHRLEKTAFSNEDEMKSWLLDQLGRAGKSWDARQPYIDLSLSMGHRLHAIFPPLSVRGISVSIRRHSCAISSEESPWKQDTAYPLLKAALQARKNILIAGATGSGKSTLLNTLLAEIPEQERILTLEDTPELRSNHAHWVSLLSRLPNSDNCGEVTLRMLLKQALRMRPDRIILGECRGDEVMELLQALNTGHAGSLATLHANCPRDALKRLELLCHLASSGRMESSVIRDLLSGALHLLVQVQKVSGHRVISQVARISGLEGRTILLQALYSSDKQGGDEQFTNTQKINGSQEHQFPAHPGIALSSAGGFASGFSQSHSGSTQFSS